MASGDGQTADELFARLPKGKQRALEEVGLGLPELRRIAAEDGSVRRVRNILDFDGDRPKEDSSTVWPWIRLLLMAVAGVVICLLSTYLINDSALLVGAVCGLAVIWAGVKAPSSRGGLTVRCLVGAAYVVLIWVGSLSADKWYLQVRGQETTVTYAKPVNLGSHGVRTLYCRVKLPDGSVRQVFHNDKWCTDTNMVGTRVDAVIDPAGHYRPVLGHTSDIGNDVFDYLCLGAAAVLVVAPLAAAVMGGVAEARGSRRGPANGTAA
ncbi:hypothetical protein [Streptomyces sp. NPDC058249]|uniref:hypothetical protein n=1 Tax=Streptomyces sp. NPDC058249 TaxID=3346403 RepID=UPI0036E2931F